MVWKDSGFPMIGKGKAQECPTCTYGPAAYKLEYGNFGSQNPKWTMRELAEIPQGPPHILVQPVDSHGKSTARKLLKVIYEHTWMMSLGSCPSDDDLALLSLFYKMAIKALLNSHIKYNLNT